MSLDQWQKPETVWGLVPGLEFTKETPSAILFTQDQREFWVPKSQINFDYWLESTYFVPISTWLLKKRDLAYQAAIPNSKITLDWLRFHEALFVKEKKSAAKPFLEVPLFPPTPTQLQKTVAKMRAAGIRETTLEIYRQMEMSRTQSTQKEQGQTRLGKSTPKRGRAMNLEEEQ